MVGYKDTEFTSSHKYIKTCTYTWDSSHRTPTEHWQKVSETQKCKNDLHITGQEEIKKKNLGRDLPHWERATKEEIVLHPGKTPSPCRDRLGGGKGASES